MYSSDSSQKSNSTRATARRSRAVDTLRNAREEVNSSRASRSSRPSRVRQMTRSSAPLSQNPTSVQNPSFLSNPSNSAQVSSPGASSKRAMRRSYKNRNRAKSQHSLSAQVGQLVGIISTILSRKIWVVCLVIAAIALGIVGPVHDFYVARRTGDVLEQKKAYIEEKNSELEAERDSLFTEEGVETQARKRGYVSPGEVGVNVEGLEQKEVEDPSKPVEYPDSRSWFDKMFDTLFGFSPQDIWNKRV